MNTVPIQLPKPLYDLIERRAATRHESPDRVVEEILTEELMPQHPYIETIDSRSGTRAVIKSTRIGVDVIAGYSQAGYAPHEIAKDILPQLTLAQIYDALSYYEDHRAEIDQDLLIHAPETWRENLNQRLGSESARKLLGE